jgi:hypothetical protein
MWQSCRRDADAMRQGMPKKLVGASAALADIYIDPIQNNIEANGRRSLARAAALLADENT